jgi:hypothetical protein
VDATEFHSILRAWPAEGLGLLEAAERFDPDGYARLVYGRAPFRYVIAAWLSGQLELVGRRGVFQPHNDRWVDSPSDPPQPIPPRLRHQIGWWMKPPFWALVVEGAPIGGEAAPVRGVAYFQPVFRRPQPAPASLMRGEEVDDLLLATKWARWQELAQAQATGAAQPAAPAPFYSGAPGRPSAMSMIEVEAQRRIKDSEVIPTPNGLSKFAKELAAWWKQRRLTFDPPGPTAKEKAIGNHLRSWWNSLPRAG